jgi:membrane protein
MMIAALQRALGAYVRQLPTYEVVYGAFAALPLFLIWLFAVWIAFLLGALLAANLRRWREPRGRDRPECAGEAFAQARLVLDALRREPGGRVEGALAISRLREAFAHDVERLDATGVLLEETGYIIRYLPLADIFGPTARSPAARLGSGSSDIWLERWAWRQDPGQLTLRPLFERLWWGGEGAHASNPATELPADFLDQPLLSSIPAIG